MRFHDVQLMREELSSQQPLYDQLQEAGVAVADRCEPDSENAIEMNAKLEEVMKRWEQLQANLSERDDFLSELLRVGLRFFASLDDLDTWLADVGQRLDILPPLSSIQPDSVLKQRQQLQVSAVMFLSCFCTY